MRITLKCFVINMVTMNYQSYSASRENPFLTVFGYETAQISKNEQSKTEIYNKARIYFWAPYLSNSYLHLAQTHLGHELIYEFFDDVQMKMNHKNYLFDFYLWTVLDCAQNHYAFYPSSQVALSILKQFRELKKDVHEKNNLVASVSSEMVQGTNFQGN
ncbi:hypothetical protein VCHA50P415_20690 [Vibrio chagasii]|nr:hypothetical protein VCHA50P415_20690 [Vibrio chagasii]